MKMNQAATASMLAVAIGVSGCVQDEEEYVPHRQAGFRPPSSAVYQEPAYSVDPSPAPLNPLPDPAPLPPVANNPAPSLPISNPNPASPAPSPAPAPLSPPSPPNPTPSPAPTPNPSPATSSNSKPTPAPSPAAAPKSPLVAKRVPGKSNYIYNPYTGAMLDVTGLTPGTEVRDPRTGETMLVP
jgi:hypothetical protein